MRRLSAIERTLERMFERPSVRIFRTKLQPVQVLRRVERAIEAARQAADGVTSVPDRVVVRLHPDDLAAFEGLEHELAMELADGALAFARAHRYTLRAAPNVILRADRRVERGDVGVDVTEVGPRDAVAQPPATRAYVAPVAAPLAVLRMAAGDGRSSSVGASIEVRDRALSIGRARDNDVQIPDARASRYHARITIRQRALVLRDLGSTNGTLVNGIRVTEVALGPGDAIEIGGVRLFVEAPPSSVTDLEQPGQAGA